MNYNTVDNLAACQTGRLPGQGGWHYRASASHLSPVKYFFNFLGSGNKKTYTKYLTRLDDMVQYTHDETTESQTTTTGDEK